MPITTGAISVVLPARFWAGIDATIDNVVSTAAVEGNEEAVQTGQEIRQAGWDQVPWVDGAWPPLDQMITITLSESQWQFAVAKVAKSAASYERIGDRESLDLCRGALASVTPQLQS